MFYTRATVTALQGQIDDLKTRLDASETERARLLDRLLAKNNIEPVTVAAPPNPQPSLRVLSPSTASTPEERTAYELSWLEEETEWLMQQHGYDSERARSVAQMNYIQHHQLIS